MIYTSPPKLLVFPANSSGSAYLRVVIPSSLLRSQGLATTMGRNHFIQLDELTTAAPDIIVFHGQYQKPQIKTIKAYKKALPHATLIYELDDQVWSVEPTNPAYADIPADVKSLVKAAVSLCDIVTVSTDQLKRTLVAFTKHKDIRVLPNSLPSRFINEAEAGRRSIKGTHPKTRIGYAGSTSHAADIAFLPEVMAHFKDSVQWVFLGIQPEGIEGYDVEYHPLVSVEDYPRALGALDLDIALAPLVDNPFNQAKSNLKLLEYGACGFPVIADAITPYANFPHVRRAPEHTAVSWALEINRLLQSPTGLDKVGTDLNIYVKDKYTMEDGLRYHMESWLPKNSTPFDPNAPTHSEPMLHLRDGVIVPAGIKDYLTTKLTPNDASIGCLHSDGIYPVAGETVFLQESLADKITEAADFAQCDPVSVPYPGGPVVMLPTAALNRLGAPNIARYGDMDSALLDWGIRALEAGMTHTVVCDTFATAPQGAIRSPEDAGKLVQHAIFWYPFIPDVMTKFAQNDPFVTVRQRVELSFMRREYGADDTRPRVLMINPDGDDPGWAALMESTLVFVADLEGHFLHLNYPAMPNVQPIDTRQPIDSFVEILGRLGIPEITVCRIGEGTVETIDFMAEVADAGWTMNANPPEGIVKPTVSAAWSRLLNKIKEREETTLTQMKAQVENEPTA